MKLKESLDVLSEVLVITPRLEGMHIMLFVAETPLLNTVGYEINIKTVDKEVMKAVSEVAAKRGLRVVSRDSIFIYSEGKRSEAP